jgi:oligopeptide transport system permease protein
MSAGRPSTWARLLRRRGSLLALLLLGGIALLCAAAPLLPLPPPGAMRPERASAAPQPEWRPADARALDELQQQHPWAVAVRRALCGTRELSGLLGSDGLGRDLCSRLLWGGRISLQVGLLATLVSALVGVAWGLVAGSAGGRIDQFMMRTVDVLYSVQLLLVVILLIAVLRDEQLAGGMSALGLDRLSVLYLVIGGISWLTVARIVRGQVLFLVRTPWVLAARALGATPTRIACRHVLPNLWGVVVVALTLTVPRVMLFEAFLSFLGLGVEPPGVSWGILASEGLEQLTLLGTAWWLIAFPGLLLMLTLSALNALGDALRDALDPRLLR